MNMPKIYAPNTELIERYYKDNYRIAADPKCNIYENVLLEPLRRSQKGKPISYEGGVCDENGKFIAGFYRDPKSLDNNRCVFTSYDPSGQTVTRLEGEYILGGFLVFEAFAHFVVDDMTRLWYTAKNYDKIDKETKIIFFAEKNKFPNKTVEKLIYSVMDLLGIEKERVVIVDKLYKVDKIHVPDQAFSFYGGYTSEYKTIYRVLAENAMKRAPEGRVYSKKVYLTRSQYAAKNCINEGYFEDMLRNQGYEIFAPETAPLDEQIRVMFNAEELACMFGSAAYLNSFSVNLKKFILLLRDGVSEYFFNKSWARYIQAYDVDFRIVDVSFNYLPTTHTGGIFLLGPTKYWAELVRDENYVIDDKDMVFDWNLFPEYAKRYLDIYSNQPENFTFVKGYDMFDVLQRLSLVINGVTLDRAKLGVKSKAEYDKEIKALQDKVSVLSKKNTQLSISENDLRSSYKDLAEKAARSNFYLVPDDLRLIPVCKSKVKSLKLQCGKNIFVNGEERKIENYLPKISQKFVSANEQWGTILSLAYVSMFEKKYDMLFYMPEGCDILFGSEDLCKLEHSAIDMVFGSVRIIDKPISECYLSAYGETEWNNILRAVEKTSPDSMEKVNEIISDYVVLSSDKFVAKRDCFQQYSQWLLGVLDDVASNSLNALALNYAEIVEVLTTIYFKAIRTEAVVGLLN